MSKQNKFQNSARAIPLDDEKPFKIVLFLTGLSTLATLIGLLLARLLAIAG
jgi:hypothetical protein